MPKHLSKKISSAYKEKDKSKRHEALNILKDESLDLFGEDIEDNKVLSCFKKIEDEYSAMKAALLSSMDSEDECSDEGFPNQDPCHKISFQALPQTLKSDQTLYK